MVSATPWPLYPQQLYGTHCTGGQVGPRTGQDGLGKSRLPGIWSPDRPIATTTAVPGPPSRKTFFCQLLCFLEPDGKITAHELRSFLKFGLCEVQQATDDWKGYAVEQNYVNEDVLMTVLDNYMFRHLLAVFRLSLRELKVLLYILSAHVVQRSLHPGFVL